MDLTISQTYAKFQRNSRCPNCHQHLWYWHDYVNGYKVSGLRFTPPKDRSAVAQCPKCHGSWPVYERETSIEIIEGPRESVPAFTEGFTLDNGRGRSTLRRTRSITHEWSQLIELSTERVEAGESGLTVGNDLVSITAVAKNSVSSSYKISHAETKTFSDELEFEVPEGLSRRVTLTFNRVWQLGRLRLTHEDGTSAEIPFRVVVGLTLDVAQEDSG